ncbi:TPA: VirB4 family type IV secretion/conjugal transfer ATPase [Legionella pneumophila]|nr:VirB4 family type IV secretion/conjugal transfer ATPase [Legionella pneumophila]HAU4041830.1 VirB4 family type IV secretion/conjugal transfer ATPase [Legionella pneumophila]HAU4054644.1 VirB4 family type IV secretion/conjugal transfer ATPase [Legionella pneumophila]HDU8241977.1 VirB4 family type IV secretion/conjugal transfer ATPase [Legionella pneumophila]HDU8251517.1 VirB4 family type IV secretion/conjugal transfer ATPase [Legionella pneumophila]
MNRFKIVKPVTLEAKVSDNFPITHLNSPSIFESQSGLIGSVLRVDGISFEVAEPEILNHQLFLLHQALIGLDSRFIVYITTHRHKASRVLTGEFKSEFAQALNERYHQRFSHSKAYENTLYLTVVLKGDDSSKTGSWIEWLKSIGQVSTELKHLQREKNCATLNNAVSQLQANLSSFGVHRLGDKDEEKGFSELLEFLSLVVNAGQSLTYPQPQCNPPIANTIPSTFKKETHYPEGHLGQYLSRYQLLFGEYVQFQGNTLNESTFGALLSLKKYPTDTVSILLDNLLSVDCEFISTHTFAPIGRDSALDKITKKRSKLINAEDKALSQMNALTELEDGIASETVLLGAHHHTLMLLAPNQEQLDDLILEATKRYASSGIVVVKETLGQEPAFWSQIPCNPHFIARASLITSENFAGFCSLHNTQSGYSHDNFLGSAVSLLESPSKTPVYFNYHARGSRTNPSKGHAAVFGGNNAGKTTLVNFLDAQMGRFGGRSFFLDRDESSKIYILASGNSRYIKIAPSNPVAMNPLQLPDTPENRSFLKSWFATLLLEEQEQMIPSHIGETINECIDYAYEQLAPEYRTLSIVSQYLPIDFPRWSHLKRWLKQDDTRIDGEFNWLFDNELDALNLEFDKVGFDVTFLMDSTPQLIATPVYLYLLHRMRQCLDGRLTSFVLAEAWQLLASPFWEKTLREWLPTIRKKNGHFIFDTQSPQSIINSPIRHIVLDNLATLIVFPNPRAEKETYIDALKLTESEFEAIKESTPESRVFLYRQEHESMLCRLDLSELSDFIRVLSGNTRSVMLLDELMNELGTEPKAWLPAFFERSAS